MGLDIYFEKRKRDYDFTDYRNLLKKRNDISDQIDKILKEKDGYAVYKIVHYLRSKKDLSKLDIIRSIGDYPDDILEIATDENIALAKQVYPLQEQYEELDKQVDEANPRKEIAYFRKVNLLMVFFNYEGNCEYKLIERGEVEDLIERCKQVLENHELAAELLPTTSGFFFGSTEYDDYYFSDVADVLHTFEGILSETDWGTEVVEMYAWY